MADFPLKAREVVHDYVASHLEPTDQHIKFDLEHVYVVWFAYVLGHWKALLSTTLPNGMYYEVTHRDETGETYLTAYKQWENLVIDEKQKVRAG